LCKKPVVVYDVDGAHDVVDNGRNGYLIPPEDIEELIKKTVQLLQNEAERISFGDNGYSKAKALFPHNVMIEHLDKLYKQILP